MTMTRTIEEKVRTALSPTHLEVINESHMHSVPPGSESHFKLVIVSAAFEGKSLVQRHQAVNKVLADELRNSLHALSMETLTGSDWETRNQSTFASPPCHGGSKTDA